MLKVFLVRSAAIVGSCAVLIALLALFGIGSLDRQIRSGALISAVFITVELWRYRTGKGTA